MLSRHALLVLLAGCAGPVVAVPHPSEPAPLEHNDPIQAGDGRPTRVTAKLDVRVREAAGAAASAIVTLTVGEDNESAPLVGTTDSNGEVQIDKPERGGRLTAMTPSGFAVATIDDKPSSFISLTLDSSCAPFNGLVHDQSAASTNPSIDVVHVVEYGVADAPTFSAKLDEAGRFMGCLAPGRYFVDSALDEVGGGVLFELPTIEPIEYIATRESSAKTEPASEPLPDASLESVIRDLPHGVGVVALGESTHGTAEFALERARFTIELAKRRKVRFVLLEAGFGETLALDRYVRNGTGDVRKAVAALRFWMWDTEEFIKSVELIRAFNKKRPSRDRIGFLGTDVQMAGGAVAFLLEDRAKTLTSDERAALAKVPDIDPSTWNDLPDAEKKHVRAILAPLATRRHAHDMRALAAASIEARLDEIGTGPELEHMRVRDRLMAEMTLQISDDGKQLSVVWAHMAHVTKRWMFGQETMGGRLQSRLGSKYFALALLGASGSTRAWDAGSKVGVIPHALEAAPRYSIEGALSTDVQGAQYIMFSRLSPDVQDWISKLRYVRFIGSTFPMSGGGWALFDVGHGFDGVVIFRSTTSTTPTPTGVRKAKTS